MHDRSENTVPLPDNPQQWRKWATEVRAAAAGFDDAEARDRMIGVAEAYEEMAERAGPSVR